MYLLTKRTALIPLIFISTIAVLGFATSSSASIETIEAPAYQAK